MKKITGINSVFLFLLLWCFIPAKSQLLWNATSPSGNISYLLGTMHLPMGNYVYDHVGVRSVLDSCDCIYTEVSTDQDSISSIIFNYIFLPEGMQISDSLNDSEWTKLDSIVKTIDPRFTASSLNRFKPMYIQMLLSFSQMKDTAGPDSQMSVDQSIRDYAQSQSKKLAFLESQDEQLDYAFNGMPLASQFVLLRKMLNRNTPLNEIENMALKLPYYYKKQDLDTLELIINTLAAGGVEERLFFTTLLENRNRKWVSHMLHLSETTDQTYFFAVGAGHLPGSVGLIAMLREKGFTVVPVLYE